MVHRDNRREAREVADRRNAHRDAAAETALPEWSFVQRDQCNGMTLTCVNCDRALGGQHHILCHAMHKAANSAQSGSSNV